MEARKTAARRSDQDAIAMLKADHERVRQLCAQYERAAGAKTPDEDRKRRLAERLCQEIDVHAQLEEELFYPAARAVLKEGDLLDEAQVEHQSARDLVRQIRAMTPGDALYDAKVKVLGEYVEHHVQEEEKQMFPKAKRAKLDMADLARRMTERRQQLEAEHSMEPFDTIASMLMMPIRAAASAARAGAAAGRRATRTGATTQRAARGAGAGATRTAGAKTRAGTGASKRPATGAATRATRATGAAAGAASRTAARAVGAATRAVGTAARSTARAAGTAVRAATTGGRAAAKSGARAAAGSGTGTGTGGRTPGARKAAGSRAAAGSGGGRATASAGSKGAAKGGRAGTKAGSGARRSRSTR